MQNKKIPNQMGDFSISAEWRKNKTEPQSSNFLNHMFKIRQLVLKRVGCTGSLNDIKFYSQ